MVTLFFGLCLNVVVKSTRQGQLDSHPTVTPNMAENPEKQNAWKCRLDQYPLMILNPQFQRSNDQLLKQNKYLS